MHDQTNIGTYQIQLSQTIYIVLIRPNLSCLEVQLQDKFNGNIWKSQFSKTDIQKLTMKCGAGKQYQFFIHMLKCSLNMSNSALRADILTAEDLQKIRTKRQFGKQQKKLQISANKRYLVMTYSTDFQKIYYPLSLSYCEDVTAARMKQTINRLADLLHISGVFTSRVGNRQSQGFDQSNIRVNYKQNISSNQQQNIEKGSLKIDYQQQKFKINEQKLKIHQQKLMSQQVDIEKLWKQKKQLKSRNEDLQKLIADFECKRLADLEKIQELESNLKEKQDLISNHLSIKQQLNYVLSEANQKFENIQMKNIVYKSEIQSLSRLLQQSRNSQHRLLLRVNSLEQQLELIMKMNHISFQSQNFKSKDLKIKQNLHELVSNDKKLLSDFKPVKRQLFKEAVKFTSQKKSFTNQKNLLTPSKNRENMNQMNHLNLSQKEKNITSSKKRQSTKKEQQSSTDEQLQKLHRAINMMNSSKKNMNKKLANKQQSINQLNLRSAQKRIQKLSNLIKDAKKDCID